MILEEPTLETYHDDNATRTGDAPPPTEQPDPGTCGVAPPGSYRELLLPPCGDGSPATARRLHPEEDVFPAPHETLKEPASQAPSEEERIARNRRDRAIWREHRDKQESKAHNRAGSTRTEPAVYGTEGAERQDLFSSECCMCSARAKHRALFSSLRSSSSEQSFVGLHFVVNSERIATLGQGMLLATPVQCCKKGRKSPTTPPFPVTSGIVKRLSVQKT